MNGRRSGLVCLCMVSKEVNCLLSDWVDPTIDGDTCGATERGESVWGAGQRVRSLACTRHHITMSTLGLGFGAHISTFGIGIDSETSPGPPTQTTNRKLSFQPAGLRRLLLLELIRRAVVDIESGPQPQRQRFD